MQAPCMHGQHWSYKTSDIKQSLSVDHGVPCYELLVRKGLRPPKQHKLLPLLLISAPEQDDKKAIVEDTTHFSCRTGALPFRVIENAIQAAGGEKYEKKINDFYPSLDLACYNTYPPRRINPLT